MQRNIHFMGHLPAFYEGVREFEALGQTLDEEFKLLAKANQEDLENYFIMTAGPDSIALWEKEIGIRADVNDTLDFRRRRLINRYTTKPPFTIRWLEGQLRELLGTGFVRTERDDDLEILYVYVDIDSVAAWMEIDTLMEIALPLSMQHEKRMSGQRNLPAQIYTGACQLCWLHLDIQPA